MLLYVGFATLKERNEHSLISHCYCSDCNKLAPEIRQHMKEIHAHEAVECDFCDFVTLMGDKLDDHMQIEHAGMDQSIGQNVIQVIMPSTSLKDPLEIEADPLKGTWPMSSLHNVNKQLSFIKNVNNQLALFKNVNKQQPFLKMSIIS